MDVSVFGKLPVQPDFFRHGMTGPPVREAERWLQESYEVLRGRNQEMPDGMTMCAVFARPEWPQVVVAVSVKSRDKVNRTFPLAIFGAIDAASVKGRAWLLPVLCGRFIKDATAALNRAVAGGDAQNLVAEAEQLRQMLNPQMFAPAENICSQIFYGQTVQSFESRVFEHPDGRFYAYRTLRMALDAVRAAFPTEPATVLGCPAASEYDIVIWAGLAARILGWPVPIPMLWQKEPQLRLLISPGPPPPQALRFLVDPDADSMRYWPLTTRHIGAMASARQALVGTAPWDNQGEMVAGLFERVATLG